MLSKILKYSVGSSLLYNVLKEKKESECCGIIGYIGKEKIADKVLTEGILVLQNRGYDSSGVTTIKNSELHTTKMTSDFENEKDCIEEIIEEIKKSHTSTTIGIAHTRWGTCGEINNKNAHPHTDSKNRIAVVHNGTILNHLKIKKDLQNKGYKFVGQTDTEVISMQIGYFLDQGEELLTAVKLTVEILDGTWGLVILHKNFPENLICARKGSPLLIGFSEKGVFVSSEAIAFQNYTDKFIRMKDREIILLSLDESVKESVKERIVHLDKAEVKLEPSEGFDCFFEEEIYEQPEAIKRSLSNFHRLIINLGVPKLGGFDSNRDKALGIRNIVLVACGSSFNACLYGGHLFKVFEVFDTVTFVEASDFDVFDLPKYNAGVIAVSQSGESADVLQTLNKIKKKGIPIIGITNVVGSLMTTLCDWGVFQNSGREIAVGATKSFTTQITVLYLIAMWYSYHRNPIKFKFERNMAIQIFPALPSLIETTLKTVAPLTKKLAKILYTQEHLFILARGNAYPFARETTLKIKEVCYIHAEAIPAGELKHGPLALIESNFDKQNRNQSHVIVLVLDNYLLQHNRVTLLEIKARKGFLIVVTDCREKLKGIDIDFIIEIPHCKPFSALLTIFPMQLLTLEMCRLKKLNPDKPRNLAKCVTVI